jgi:glycerol-3-phosphate dehydrogenase
MNRPETPSVYDAAIIGAGVVGCAIARHLAQFDINCILLDAAADVGTGTSKANTAILHTGFDSKPGTIESMLVRQGYEQLKIYADEVGIPVDPTGALLVAWEPDQAQALEDIEENATRNSVNVRPVSAEEIYEMEPALGPGALKGLQIPGESIICPFTTTLAYATQALNNGVNLLLEAPVQAIAEDDGHYVVSTPRGEVRCRYLVNAAGLGADIINGMLGHAEFSVQPRRGELIVFDKFSAALVNHILLPVPGKMGKGVLISPTVYGNVLLGPTAEDIGDRAGTETTAAGLAGLLEKGDRILPSLLDEEITATYSGIRAATEHNDYQIHSHPDQRYVCVGGIRSTGLSASMAIGEYIAGLLADMGLALAKKEEFHPVRMPNIGERQPRPYQLEAFIRENAAYGEIVCHCEKVTRGEIEAAMDSRLPPADLDGLRRRTRALMGRCQGFYCHADVLALHLAGRRSERSTQAAPEEAHDQA